MPNLTNDSLPPVFVISLPQSAARRRVMAARLEALGVPYSFFDGVVGAQLDLAMLPAYARARRRFFFGKDLTAGEVGCLLSHRAVYQHMVDRNILAAVVLEDDAVPAADFAAAVAAVMKIPATWDVVRFLGREKVYRNSRTVMKLNDHYTLTRPLGTPGGTYGYALTQKAARVFVAHMRRNWLPVDILHGFVWRTGLEAFAVMPSPVMPDDGVESTIGDGRFDKTVRLRGWQKAAYPLTRFSFKIYQLVMTRLAAACSWPRDYGLRAKMKEGGNGGV